MFRRTQSVHFVGIGGVGMSGIAEILLTLGYRITGSDIKTSERTQHLARKGAEIYEGHDPSHVADADVVVMTSAVDESNEEIREAHRRGIPVIPRAEMLAELMRLKEGIAVAGTHGKTTTTAMLSSVLQAGDCDPTVVVGGRLHNLELGARLGSDDQIVVEADESDGSFLHLSPVMGVVTNIENDHLDFYDDMQEMESVYLDFINSVPFYGFMALCGDDPRLYRLRSRIRKPFRTYGFGRHNHLRAAAPEMTDRGMRFQVERKDQTLGEVRLAVPGYHNVLNALGAAAIGFEQGLTFESVRRGLESFEGVVRRFDFKGREGSFQVYDDYAHHPTEIASTLSTARERFEGELLVIFQPHRYSRTRDLSDEFGPAFEHADRLCVTDVYPAGESPIEGIDLEFLESAIEPYRNGDPTTFRSEWDAILDWVERVHDPDRKQVIFTLGAGDVVDLAEPILERVRHQRESLKA